MVNDVDANRGPVLLSVSVTTTAFALLMCGVRFLVRHRLGSKLRWDDYSIVVSAMLAIIGTALTVVEGSSTKDLIRAAKYNFLSQPWLLFSSIMAKTSICIFLLRTVGRRLGRWNVSLAALVLIMVVANFMTTLVLDLHCRPMRKIWDSRVAGECFGEGVGLNAAFASAGFEVFSFFFLAVFSAVLIRVDDGLPNMRWTLCIVAALNLIGGVLCIVKAYEVSLDGIRGEYIDTPAAITLLSILTQNTSITAANILPLGLLLARGAEQLSLPSSSDIEDHAEASPAFFTIKGSGSTLTIQGPPKDAHVNVNGQIKRKPVHRPKRSQQFETVTLEGMPGIGEPVDMEEQQGSSFKMTIVKTTTIEVVEESIAEVGKTPTRARFKAHAKVKTATPEDWQHILKGSRTEGVSSMEQL